MKIKIYTDGGCWPNPGEGGWAFIILTDGAEIGRAHGYEASATNNAMEITAAIRAFEWLRLYPRFNRESSILVHSDSQYLINGITKWIAGWQKRGWVTKDRSPVKNRELWQHLAHVIITHARWQWVRGHNGNEWNEQCDQMCMAARRTKGKL